MFFIVKLPVKFIINLSIIIFFKAGRVLERGQSEIRYQYDHEVKVQTAIIITWVGMQPIGDSALPDEVGFKINLKI